MSPGRLFSTVLRARTLVLTGDAMNVTHFRNGQKLQTLVQLYGYDYNAPRHIE